MPESDKLSVIVRQWDMLHIIAEYENGITVRDLADRLNEDKGHKASVRTIQRDLNEIAHVFGLEHDGPEDTSRSSAPRRWKMTYPLEISSLSLADAVSLSIAREALQILPESMLKLLEPKFTMAEAKLNAIQNNLHVRRIQKVRYIPATFTQIPPKIRPNILKAVQQALFDEKQIEIQYDKPNERKSKSLTLHPLSLVQRGTVSYLVATTFDYETPCLYAIHRIRTVRQTENPIKIPSGYSLDQYISSGALEFEPGKEIELKAWVSADLGSYLEETPLSKKQKITFENGRWQLTANVRTSWQLHFWILSQGSRITVTAPDSLRRSIQAELESAAKSYKTTAKRKR